MKTIIIVDDHVIVRTGLRSLVERAAGLSVVGEAGDAEEALALCARLKPDLAIVDWRLPDGDGCELCSRMAECSPSTRVLILTAYPTSSLAESALKCGAFGILLKTVDGAGILRSIDQVLSGQVIVDPNLAASWAEGVRASRHAPALTELEQRMLRLLALGLSNKEMASELGRAEKTLRNGLSVLYRKIGVGSRVEAALYALGTHAPP